MQGRTHLRRVRPFEALNIAAKAGIERRQPKSGHTPRLGDTPS